MPVQDLKDAYAAGKTLSDLMSDKNLDAATVRQNLLSAYDEALAAAVKGGVITQEQSDEMQNGKVWAFGFGGMPGPGGRGGFRGHDGFGGMRRSPPDTDDDTSGMRFRRPGQAPQAGSAL